jgi:hypothetical protein
MKAAVLIAGFALAVGGGVVIGRVTAPPGLVDGAAPRGPRVAAFSGGALGADDVRPVAAVATDAGQRRAAVESLVRARLLALEAEAAGLHRSPEFLARYSEELARLQIQKAFDEPFQKQLPTEDELRKFFDDHKDRLGRPARVRLALVALAAPASDEKLRAEKRTRAAQLLADARRARDDYAFGRLAMQWSEDPISRPAAGELPFATREELVARLGAETADAAFAAQPGTVVERVLESDEGFQIVKVLAREDGREARYDELRDQMFVSLKLCDSESRGG